MTSFKIESMHCGCIDDNVIEEESKNLSNIESTLEYDLEGNVISEEYTKGRGNDLPSLIGYRRNKKWIELYHKKDTNQLHREGYPALIKYFTESNKIKKEVWYQNNKVFRLNGPARIRYNHIGKPIDKRYYLKEVEVSQKLYNLITYKLRCTIEKYKKKKRETLSNSLKDKKINNNILKYLSYFVF